MTEFFQTIMGKQFFDRTMPRLVTVLERIAERLDHPRDALFDHEALDEVVKNSSDLSQRACELAGALEEFLFHTKRGTDDTDNAVLHAVCEMVKKHGFGPVEEREESAPDKAMQMATELQCLFWSNGPDTEHGADTLGEIANMLKRYGYGSGEKS